MMKIRHAIPGPVSHLSDDDVLGLIATEIGRGRMVLTDDFLDQPKKRSVTASGEGMTTTIRRADGSSEIRTGNRPWRNYNPGDIEVFPRDPDPFAFRHGAVGVEGGFAIFPDEQTGFAALKALLLSEKYQPRTILETMKRFAPASDHNDPVGYAKMLSDAVSAPATTKLAMLSSAQVAILVNKIAQVEGYYHAGSTRVVPAR